MSGRTCMSSNRDTPAWRCGLPWRPGGPAGWLPNRLPAACLALDRCAGLPDLAVAWPGRGANVGRSWYQACPPRFRDSHDDLGVCLMPVMIGIDPHKGHVTAIMRRLGVASRFAAGATAQRKGWIG